MKIALRSYGTAAAKISAVLREDAGIARKRKTGTSADGYFGVPGTNQRLLVLVWTRPFSRPLPPVTFWSKCPRGYLDWSQG